MGIIPYNLTIGEAEAKEKLRRNSALFIGVNGSTKAKLERFDDEFGWPTFVSDSGRCKLGYFTNEGNRGNGYQVGLCSYKCIRPISAWVLEFNGTLH